MTAADGRRAMNLNLITGLESIGYGYVGRYVLKELLSAGVRVALFPLSYALSVSDDPQHPVNVGVGNAERYDPGAPSVRIAQARTQAEHVVAASTSAFPFLSSIDWMPPRSTTCSSWTRSSSARSGRQESSHRAGQYPAIRRPAWRQSFDLS